MKRYFSIVLLFLSMNALLSQEKQDYIWLLGTDRSSEPGVQAYKFDFNIKPFTIVKYEIGTEFAHNNASICDKEGNLLFYSNGCAVLNRDAEIMPNGDSINYDIFWDISGWNDCERLGYPGTQNSIILNDPGDMNQYYILHKPFVFEDWENYDLMYLWYSKVDLSLDEGFGDVIEKNVVLYDERQTLSSYLTAINHANGKDWWIIQPLQEDSLFLTFLLTTNGFERQEDQKSHEFFRKSGTSAAGTARFSPDGKKYVLYAYENNLHIYDFDRSTGTLSNHQKVVIYDSIDSNDIRFSSVEWSPNSRFIYTASRDELHQIDTWEDDLQDGVQIIDTYDGTQNPFPNTFFLMAQGPDCRIYMCSTSGNETYHVINHPDSLGLACDFVQNGIKLPYEAGFGTMPNFPRFRVDEDEKCDPTIVSVFGDAVWYKRDLEVYPNPSSGVFNIRLPEIGNGRLAVIDMQGRIVQDIEVETQGLVPPFDSQEFMRVDISRMPAGRYNIELYPVTDIGLKLQTSNRRDRVFYGAQVVKVE